MRREKRKMLFTLLFLLLLGLGIGYAALSTNLSIDGTSTMLAGNWDIHFDRIVVSSGSVAIGTEDSAATITSPTTVAYNITLAQPGDFYEFTVDVVNGGTIDAMIETISSKLNGTEITTLPGNLEYSVTYSDGIGLLPNQLLSAGDTETYRIRIKYKEDLELEDLVPGGANLSLSFSVTYIQADEYAVEVDHPDDFSTDSWDTIVAAVQNDITDVYDVGDTKPITLGNGLGTHTLRIANKSTPEECSNPGFSQTACGFVLEFEDIITTHPMNSNNSNAGGWPACEMRAYLNNENSSTSIINSLPEELRNAIIDTMVVSGYHPSSATSNYVSTDKLYLLSPHEVWEDVGTSTLGISALDKSYNNTRQLDYYLKYNTTTVDYSSANKIYDGGSYYWWLRSARYNISTYFFAAASGGNWNNTAEADSADGVSPAFRIG